MKFAFLLAFLALAGCAATEVSPSQNYVLGKQELRITGNVTRKPEPPFFMEAKRLTVHINGEPVISGKLTDNFTGELSGRWKNHTVTALCTSERKNTYWTAVQCPILIDEKRTVTLSF